MEDRKIQFLYQSISDTQAIIRGLDVKIGFLFVVVFLPLAGMKEAAAVYKGLAGFSSFAGFAALMVVLLWIVSVYLLFKAKIAISNPSKFVDGCTPQGVFFDGAQFKMSFVDAFFNFPMKSEKTIEENIKRLPASDDQIISELMYEKMKLAYIRDVKIKRVTLCSVFVVFWVVLGVSLWAVWLVWGQ